MPWLFLLAAWLLGLVAAAAGYALWNSRGLELHLRLTGVTPVPGSPAEWLPDAILRTGPDPVIFEGDQMAVEVGLDTTRGPRGPAQVTGSLGGQVQSFGAGVVPRDGWRQTLDRLGASRGVITAKGWQIVTSDFLGFFRHRQKWADFEVGAVFPKFVSLASRRRARELEASVSASRAGAGTELFGVREFRPGDSLRRIHWRSSARHGELIVREYEPPGLRTLCVFVDSSPSTRDVAGQIARIAASEAWDCIRDGGRVVLWAPGTQPTQSPADLWTQLDWLARYPEGVRDPWGWGPNVGDEVVFVTAGGDAEVIDAVEAARSRGSRVRGWVIGDAEIDVDAECDRVGTEWPL